MDGKCLGSKVCLCLCKNCKKWQVFCTIPDSPGSVLWQKTDIVMLGSWGACLQLMLNNAYLGRCIICCRETPCWEERAHGNSSTDTTLFPESSFALWAAGEQVVTLNQQSTTKFSVSPFWKGIGLVFVWVKGAEGEGRKLLLWDQKCLYPAGLSRAPGDYGFTTPASTCQPKNAMKLRFFIHLSYWGVWHGPVRTLCSTKRLSEPIICKSLSSI